MDCLYIVIPAYNESMNIEAVARDWHNIVSTIGGKSKLVIIDDGSKDNTYNKLLLLKKEMPYLVPLTKKNSGHGATLLFGYNYAIENQADYIFQTDSDGQTISSEFWNFWNQRSEYAALIGFRKFRQDGLSRVFVTKVLKFVLWLVFGVNIPDANTPFRLIQQNTLKKYISKIPDNFNLSNVLLSVLLIKTEEKVLFIPITFRPRQGGVNSINFPKIVKIGKKAFKDFCIIKKQLKK